MKNPTKERVIMDLKSVLKFLRKNRVYLMSESIHNKWWIRTFSYGYLLPEKNPKSSVVSNLVLMPLIHPTKITYFEVKSGIRNYLLSNISFKTANPFMVHGQPV
jgi:hypothetical protein